MTLNSVAIGGGSKNEITLFEEHESVEDLLYEFLKGRTKLTEVAYRRDLRDFFAFTQSHFGLPRLVDSKLRFEEIRRVHIVKYKNWLEANNSARRKPFAPNSVNRKISTISSFFQFLVRREVINQNPVDLCIRPKRIVIDETQAFSDREMKNLFDLVIAEAPPLHKAVILLLFTSGIRQAELRNIRLSDFSNSEGMRLLRYIRKGQKMNKIPVHPTAGHYIDEYIEWMERIGRKVKESDFLFQPTKNTYDGETKKKLSHTAVGYIVKKWARKVNSEKRITPHSARATFISSLIDNGEDIYYISQLVNHADVRTTQRYNKRKRSFRRNPVFNLNFF